MVTNYKNELWKTVRWTSFQKPQLQSVSFFFKFFHPYFPQYLWCHLHLLQTFRAVMHQSIPAAPSPHPPRLLRGICLPFQSRGWGICKFCYAREPCICHPRGYSRAFDTHAVSYQNATTERILLKKKQISSSLKDRGLYGFHICMHFFIAYQATITWGN